MEESPKHSLLDSPSPTREQKARQAVAEATASAGNQKWKMHIGAGTSGNSRFKKKQPERLPSTEWLNEQDKHAKSEPSFDDSPPKKIVAPPVVPPEKSLSVRRVMALKEPPKKPESPRKIKPLAPAPLPNKIPQGQVVLDKFGNFRLMTPPELKKGNDLPPLPPGTLKFIVTNIFELQQSINKN